MMRIAEPVDGSGGDLADRAGGEFEIVPLGRRVFLLEDRGAVLAALKTARPGVVINAAVPSRPASRRRRRFEGTRTFRT
jgi:hypothetical protein